MRSNLEVSRCYIWEAYLESGKRKEECAGSGRRKGGRDSRGRRRGELESSEHRLFCDAMDKEEFFSEFDRCLISTRKETMKLELPDEYNYDAERETFEEFKKTGKVERAYKRLQGWLDQLKELKSRGVKLRRVHVVSLPLSMYLKYEIQYYRLYNGIYEDVRLIERAEFNSIQKQAELTLDNDFFIMDDRVMFFTIYEKLTKTKFGNLIAGEKIDDVKQVKRYATFYNKVFNAATPMEDFLAKIGEP
jgi:hypothetical protein